jgi:hypothetical protein
MATSPIVYSAQMLHRALFSLVAAGCAALLQAQSGPKPPCGEDPVPGYPSPAASPSVKVWTQMEWPPPKCTGWGMMASATLVGSAGQFNLGGGSEELRRRIAVVSQMNGLLYWSTTHQKWQPLITESYGLTALEGGRRADFTAREIEAGRTLFLKQSDNLLGPVTYQMRIIEASDERIVFGTENRIAIRYLGLALFQPGEIQAVTFLERERGSVWRYYSIARMAKAASILTMGHDASLINRAVALFRHVAGIPADREPPAAR